MNSITGGTFYKQKFPSLLVFLHRSSTWIKIRKLMEDKVWDAFALYKAEQREDFKFYTSWTILWNAPKFNKLQEKIAADKIFLKRKKSTSISSSILLSRAFSVSLDEESDNEDLATHPSYLSSPSSTVSASMLAPRPKGKKARKKILNYQSSRHVRLLLLGTYKNYKEEGGGNGEE